MVLIYALTLIYFAYPIDEVSINKSGVFGDSFGVLTALFSGLAFAGIIISIKMQNKQLRLQRKELTLTRLEVSLQREELTLTRQEIRGQKKELKYQNRTMKKQAFEYTLFQMLSVHNDIVSNMKFSNPSGSPVLKLIGRGCFRYHGSHPMLQTDFPKYYILQKENISQYLNNLYQILKFIDTNKIKSKRQYIEILMAQISDHELVIVFYYALSEESFGGFKLLIEKYGLFQSIKEMNSLPIQKYDGSAYTD